VSELEDSAISEREDGLALVRDMFESKIAFNRLLGFWLRNDNYLCLRFDLGLWLWL